MEKIIAVANHKGGVGKTTSVANIGAGLALRGYKVLLIDLDAQANLTAFFMGEEPERVINSSLSTGEPLPIYPIKENLSLIPADLELSSVELGLYGRMDREYILQELIEPIKSLYDYILIDCPPSLGLLTLNALVASTDLYITLTAEGLPAKGLNNLMNSLSSVQKRANKGLKLSGIILTRWQGRNLNKDLESLLRANYGDILFNSKIRENIALAEAPLQAEDIFSYNPNSNGAKDYKALIDEILIR